MPSLNALRSFEAVARTGSVSRAAQWLCVTQGAVSHQTAQLEEWLGVSLLRRDGRGIALTEAGRELAEAASASFRMLSEACARVRGSGARELHLAAPGSFLANWLIPRLGDFEASHAGLCLRLRTDGGLDELRHRRLDALVTCGGPASAEGIVRIPFAAERLGIVCRREDAAGLATGQEARRLTKLSCGTRPEAWKDWSRAAKRTVRGVSRAFDHFPQMLEAVRAGLGVAVVPELLVERELQRGELAAPLGFVASGGAFALSFLEVRGQEPGIAALVAWLSRKGEPGSSA